MALNVLTSQLSESVEYLVPRRQKDFDYIKRAHQGKVHWLNTVLLSKTTILNGFTPEKLKKRLHRWFVLGISIARLLELPNDSQVVRAACQTIEEFQHFIEHDKEREAKKNTFPSYSHRKPLTTNTQQHKDTDPIKPSLHKIKGTVVYEYLTIPFNPTSGTADSMDYCEVLYTLCDTFILLYSKFSDDFSSLPILRDGILKFDKAIRKLVVGKICNDLTEISTGVMKRDMHNMLNHLFVDASRSNKITRKFYLLSDNQKKLKGTGEGDEFQQNNEEQEE